MARLPYRPAKLRRYISRHRVQPENGQARPVLRAGENVAGKTRIIQGDVFKEDFSKASVVTMYLLPELICGCVRPSLNMLPGTQITSHQFKMGDWEPDKTAVAVPYRISVDRPPKVEGTWTVREQGGGNAQYTINLNQTYQKISGDVAAGTASSPCSTPSCAVNIFALRSTTKRA